VPPRPVTANAQRSPTRCGHAKTRWLNVAALAAPSSSGGMLARRVPTLRRALPRTPSAVASMRRHAAPGRRKRAAAARLVLGARVERGCAERGHPLPFPRALALARTPWAAQTAPRRGRPTGWIRSAPPAPCWLDRACAPPRRAFDDGRRGDGNCTSLLLSGRLGWDACRKVQTIRERAAPLRGKERRRGPAV
jgi:hypothetical protein